MPPPALPRASSRPRRPMSRHGANGRPACCRSTGAATPGSTPTASAPRCWRRTGRSTKPGAAVASLSIPWGFSKGDDDLGGYHLVWPRDLVETAGGFLAAGDADAGAADPCLSPLHPAAGRPLAAECLARRHRPIGRASRWTNAPSRCCWPTRCAAPGTCRAPALAAFMPMIEKAASYVVRNGPVTGRGPLGGGCRLQPVHARRRDLGAACRGRPVRRLRQSGAG